MAVSLNTLWKGRPRKMALHIKKKRQEQETKVLGRSFFARKGNRPDEDDSALPLFGKKSEVTQRAHLTAVDQQRELGEDHNTSTL